MFCFFLFLCTIYKCYRYMHVNENDIDTILWGSKETFVTLKCPLTFLLFYL